MIARTRSRSDGTVAVLAAICLVGGLGAKLVASSPTALQERGLRDALVVLADLIVCSVLALWARRRRQAARVRDNLQIGARIGSVLVVIELLNLGIEHFVGDSRVSAVRGVATWGAMFLAFGLAGSAAAHGSRSAGSAVQQALVASVWCGIIGALGAVSGGLVLAACFMPAMIRILVPNAGVISAIAARSQVARHTLSAASQHLLFMPVVAALCGVAGAVASLLVLRLPRSIARGLLPVITLIALAGIVSLRFASGRPRPQRPPFVGLGLLALGLSLVSAYPLMKAVRRRSASDGALGPEHGLG